MPGSVLPTLIAAFVLTGASAMAAQAAAFRCGEARIEARTDGDALALWLDGGRRIDLQPVVTASGARYDGTVGGRPVVFWTKGTEATLRVGERLFPTCREVVASAEDHAPVYVARGNEPGWSVEVAADRITLLTDYGAARIVVPRPAPEEVPGGYRYDAAAEAHRLRLVIEARVCRDDMAGTPYPDRVTVTVDGRELRGCGGSPAALLQGGAWTVLEIADAAVVEAMPPTLAFGDDGRLTGTTGCNAYTGPYAVTGEGLSVGRLAATRRACPSALTQQETTFLQVLGSLARYDLREDGALVLHANDGRTMIAVRG